MPSKSSHAGHIPKRTCVICRSKQAKASLWRFIVLEGKYVLDLAQVLSGRGFYICESEGCLTGLEKWLKRRRKRR